MVFNSLLSRITVISYEEFTAPEGTEGSAVNLWSIVSSESEYVLGVLWERRWLFGKKGNAKSVSFGNSAGSRLQAIGLVGGDLVALVED